MRARSPPTRATSAVVGGHLMSRPACRASSVVSVFGIASLRNSSASEPMTRAGNATTETGDADPGSAWRLAAGDTPPSESRSSPSASSRAVWNRWRAFFARHFRIRSSSATDTAGLSDRTGAGAWWRMASISRGITRSRNGLSPVSIS